MILTISSVNMTFDLSVSYICLLKYWYKVIAFRSIQLKIEINKHQIFRQYI